MEIIIFCVLDGYSPKKFMPEVNVIVLRNIWSFRL